MNAKRTQLFNINIQACSKADIWTPCSKIYSSSTLNRNTQACDNIKIFGSRIKNFNFIAWPRAEIYSFIISALKRL